MRGKISAVVFGGCCLAIACSLLAPPRSDYIEDDAATAFDATPTCEGESGFCVPRSMPTGWLGPAIVWSGTNGPPKCPADWAAFAVRGGTDPDGAPATCTCECGKSQVPPTYSASMALGPASCGSCEASVGPGCNALACKTAAFVSATITATGGSCIGVADASIAPVKWGTSFLACALTRNQTQAECAEGTYCYPRPPPPFRPEVCIYHPGALSCPIGYAYASAPTVVYQDASDTRNCTSCGCAPTAGDSSIAFYRDTCATLTYYIRSPTCMPFPEGGFADQNTIHVALQEDPKPPCVNVDGGVATGSVAPETPVTLCCTVDLETQN